MPRDTDTRVKGTTLYYLPVETRVPLKFGPETLSSVTCARVELTVADQAGRTASGWGETPLSVQWVWPSALSYAERHEVLKEFTVQHRSAKAVHKQLQKAKDRVTEDWGKKHGKGTKVVRKSDGRSGVSVSYTNLTLPPKAEV